MDHIAILDLVIIQVMLLTNIIPQLMYKELTLGIYKTLLQQDTVLLGIIMTVLYIYITLKDMLQIIV